MSDQEFILSKVKEIEDFCGLKVTPCDYFTGIRGRENDKFFNVILNERVSFSSREYHKLQRMVEKGLFKRVSQNGIDRVAIYF